MKILNTKNEQQRWIDDLVKLGLTAFEAEANWEFFNQGDPDEKKRWRCRLKKIVRAKNDGM